MNAMQRFEPQAAEPPAYGLARQAAPAEQNSGRHGQCSQSGVRPGQSNNPIGPDQRQLLLLPASDPVLLPPGDLVLSRSGERSSEEPATGVMYGKKVRIRLCCKSHHQIGYMLCCADQISDFLTCLPAWVHCGHWGSIVEHFVKF